MLRKARIGLGLPILAISIFILVWGIWPAHRETRIRPVSVPAGRPQEGNRQITLLFPPKIRTGDTGIVRLTLDDQDNLLPTPQSAGIAAGDNTTLSSNFDDTQKVVAEARFDIPGMNVRPSELISASISGGQSAVFYWTLRPDIVGEWRGTIWVYLRTVDKATGQERRETVSAQMVEIKAVDLFGLSAKQARLVGIAGSVIGLALSLLFFEAFARGFVKKRQKPIK
jgi:hypothetical protein